MVVGNLELDALEAGAGGGFETVQERDLGKQVMQVGGEFGHSGREWGSGSNDILVARSL